LLSPVSPILVLFVAVDGTKIKANASKEFTGTVEDFKKKQKRIENKIEQIIDHTLSTTMDEKYAYKMHKKLDALQRKKKKIDEFLMDIENRNDTDTAMPSSQQISLTDRDARMVKDNEKKYMGYNCHIAVDAEKHVIIGGEVGKVK